MDSLYILLAAVFSAAITYISLKRCYTSAPQEAAALKQEIEALKTTKATLETRLAVEEQKASRVPLLEEQLSAESARLVTIKEAKAALEATLEQEHKQATEKLALLVDAKNSMTQEFKILADNAMKTQGETFSKQNKEQIDALLNPLREKLGEFNQSVQTATKEGNKERAILAERIQSLTESSAKMTAETTNLTKALKGDQQTQGAWGEMILASILERSGLREGQEYTSQESHTHEDGSRVRTDVIINIPDGQKIIVDSKVSLVAFERYVNAPDADKAAHLSAHMVSLRNHIKTLASKEYQFAAGSHLDYVVMFIPIEGALAAALHNDPALTSFAVENNVAIATPTTLMMALRTVANVWQVERRNRNAEAIAERAGKIYDKLAGFVDDMTGLGRQLELAKGCYEKGMSKLHTGRGNLLNQVEQLKTLGAKTSKTLPSSDEDVTTDVPEQLKISDSN